jgi:hypothetical protein
MNLVTTADSAYYIESVSTFIPREDNIGDRRAAGGRISRRELLNTCV